MLILNAGISHNLMDWLMCLIIESEKIREGQARRDLG